MPIDSGLLPQAVQLQNGIYIGDALKNMEGIATIGNINATRAHTNALAQAQQRSNRDYEKEYAMKETAIARQQAHDAAVSQVYNEHPTALTDPMERTTMLQKLYGIDPQLAMKQSADFTAQDKANAEQKSLAAAADLHLQENLQKQVEYSQKQHDLVINSYDAAAGMYANAAKIQDPVVRAKYLQLVDADTKRLNDFGSNGAIKTGLEVPNYNPVDPTDVQRVADYFTAKLGIKAQWDEMHKELDDKHKAEPKPDKSIFGPSGTPAESFNVEAYIKEIENGHADPGMSDLTTRGVEGAKARIQVLQRWNELHPETPLQALKGKRAYWNNDKTQRQLQVMNVVSEQMPVLLQAANDMERGGIPSLNKLITVSGYAAGNPEVAAFLTAHTASIEDIAKAIAGGNASPTNEQLALAERLLPKNATPAQMRAGVAQIINGVNSRKYTVYRQGGLYGKLAARDDEFLKQTPALWEKITGEKLTDGQEINNAAAAPATPTIAPVRPQTKTRKTSATPKGELEYDPTTGTFIRR